MRVSPDAGCDDGKTPGAKAALGPEADQREQERRDAIIEECAAFISTGDFCRYVEHAQEYCDCFRMAAALRAKKSTTAIDQAIERERG